MNTAYFIKRCYNEKYFMVADLKGVNRIYSISEIILGVPEELFNLFSDLKPIDFIILIIKMIMVKARKKVRLI